MRLIEQCKVIPVNFPKSGNGDSDVWSMKQFAHCDVVIQTGSGANANTVAVLAGDNTMPSNTSAINFLAMVASGDVYSAITSVAAGSTLSLPATSNLTAVVSFKAQDLPSGKPYAQIDFGSAPANLMSVIAVCSNGRFKPRTDVTDLT